MPINQLSSVSKSAEDMKENMKGEIVVIQSALGRWVIRSDDGEHYLLQISGCDGSDIDKQTHFFDSLTQGTRVMFDIVPKVIKRPFSTGNAALDCLVDMQSAQTAMNQSFGMWTDLWRCFVWNVDVTNIRMIEENTLWETSILVDWTQTGVIQAIGAIA